MSALRYRDVKPIVHRAFKIAMLVGPTLTLINQWETVTALQMPNLAKMGLTFVVPFCVSFFSGYAMRKSIATQLCANKALIQNLRDDAAACSERARNAETALAAIHVQKAGSALTV